MFASPRPPPALPVRDTRSTRRLGKISLRGERDLADESVFAFFSSLLQRIKFTLEYDRRHESAGTINSAGEKLHVQALGLKKLIPNLRATVEKREAQKMKSHTIPSLRRL